MRATLSFPWILVLLTLGVPAADSGFPLPIKKVVLYKSGVGYFHHQGVVDGSQPIEIPLSSSQLDDVLKSLTILDVDGGQVGAVTYGSSASISKQLGDLPIDLSSTANLVEVLNRLRGAQVILELPGERLEGRIVGAEYRHAGDGNDGTETVMLSLFVAPGDLRTIRFDSVGNLTFADQVLANDITRYLELQGSQNERSLRRLRFRAEGSGQRTLMLSYTSEAPIWKATYRAVLRSDTETLLQGWAVVDNTTPIDWTDVELSLVSGAPVSFVQRLSEPVYADRPVVGLPTGVRVDPATHEGTMEELAPTESEAFAKAAMPEPMRQRSLTAMSPGVAGAADSVRFDQALERSAPPAAVASRLAEQFEYRIREPITIQRNQSALLPIVQLTLPADKLAVFNEGRDRSIPRLALWLKNASELTLDGGSFSVIDQGAFAGEGIFDTIQPGERRLLSYALDLAVEVSTTTGTERRGVERVTIQNGILTMHRKLVEKREYRIRNNAAQSRQVLIEHPVRPEWKLVEDLKPEETSSSYYRFKVSVAPSSSQVLGVTVERPEEAAFRLIDISPDQLTFWIRDRSLDSSIQGTLQRLAEKKAQIARLQLEIDTLVQQESQIFSDQERIRENLARLSRNAEEASLRQRYLDQLNAQENQLQELRSQRGQAEERLRQTQSELAEMIEGLSFDRRIG